MADKQAEILAALKQATAGLAICLNNAPVEQQPAIREWFEAGRAAIDRAEAKPRFTYEPWRHGGWYTNVYYPSGACGCVSRNYDDGKWRIACDPRPFDERPTFKNRDQAAFAEWELAEADWKLVRAAAGDLFNALERAVGKLTDPFCLKLANEALAKAKGQSK